jgi:hypothetical protein
MAQTKSKSKSKSKASSKRRPSSPKASKPSSNSHSNSTASSAKSTPATMASKAVDKAKVPLMAGGAVLAGAAGGIAVGTRRAHRQSRMDKAIKLAHELQQVRQPTANGKRRSPVEVVLEGLTARGSRR